MPNKIELKRNQTIDYNDDSTMRHYVHDAKIKRGDNKQEEDTEKGLLDKIIDFTGEKFQKFGDLFRNESPILRGMNDSGLKTERINYNSKAAPSS